MINFTQLQEIIPNEGALVLSFTKTENTVTVLYAPKIKGKEQSEEFGPLLLKGTAEELTAEFAVAVRDIAKKQQVLAALQAAKTVSGATAKKSGLLDKAIAKASSAAPTKAISGTCASSKPVKPEPPKPMDLFSAALPRLPVEERPAARAQGTLVAEPETTVEQEVADGVDS